MAGADDRSDCIEFNAIPVADLRKLSRSDLQALSISSNSSLRRLDDIVIPKIDRAVFNESAGSRKQTYSRLRLASRNSKLESDSRPPERATSADDRVRKEENRQVSEALKELFSDRTEKSERVVLDQNALIPGSVNDEQLQKIEDPDVAKRNRKRERRT